ncbi:MAG: response regulator transcription factor [Pigmentiphaga sp.]
MFSSSQIRRQIFSAVRAVVPTGRLCLYDVDANLDPCDFRFDDGDTRWIPVYPRFRHLDPFHPRHFWQRRESVFGMGQGCGTTAQSEAYLKGFLHPMGMSCKLEAFLRDPAGRIVGGIRLSRPPAMGDFLPGEYAALRALQPLMSSAWCASGARHDPVLPGLTSREAEVFEMVLAGETNKRIALELGMALPTVKTHVRSLLRKADQPNRVALIARYGRCPSTNAPSRR